MAEYIEREALLEEINEKISNIAFNSPYQDEVGIMVSGMSRIRDSVEDAPAADVVPVVRCKDCRYSRGLNEKERLCVCDDALICKNSEAHVDGWNPMWPDDFCSYGERKEADSNG